MKTAGEATLTITLSGTIQTSTFGANAFRVQNTGGKTITRVEIDIARALFPDVVFDPFGLSGDSVAKRLTIDTDGATGVIAPSDGASYGGAGGAAGYDRITISFDPTVNGGFGPGEAIGFSVDVDPKSSAGAPKPALDAGALPGSDVGGVSGAELIGSLFTVVFDDGTTAQGRLQGVKTGGGAASQSGALAVAPEAASAAEVALEVESGASSFAPGDAGVFSEAPRVFVAGPLGATARIVVATGFAQPARNLFAEPYASTFDAGMAALIVSVFPANNAIEFEIVDVALTGERQEVTDRFVFETVPVSGVDNAGRLPLSFVAGLIDPADADAPIGPVTAPIHLRAANAAPVAADDAASTGAGVAVALSPLADDADADGDALRLWSFTQGAHGSVVRSGGDAVTYAPDAGFTGTDSFFYTVSDGLGGSDVATVSVTVEGSDGGQTSLALNAGGAALDGVDGIDWEGDGFFTGGRAYATGAAIANTEDDALYQSERYGDFSYAVPVANGDYVVMLRFAEIYWDAAGERLFDVAAEDALVIDDLDIWAVAGGKNVAYDVALPVSVADGTLDLDFITETDNAKVSAIRVDRANGSNTPPLAADDKAALDEDASVTIAVLENDEDADGDALRILSATQGAHGAVLVNPDGTATYTPEAEFNGFDVFTYTLSDGRGGLDEAAVSVTVAAVNDAPEAADDMASTAEGEPVAIAVLANDVDVDGDALGVASLTQGANGEVSPGAEGAVTYTPDAGFTGTDSFFYTVSDGLGGSDVATVSVTVEGSDGGQTSLALNAGGAALDGVDGIDWEGDGFFTGGRAYATGAAIANTEDDALYQSERYGDFSYAVPVANGDYVVMLRFAEIYWDAAGERLFDVAAEDALVIDDLDIWAVAGGKNVAYDVALPVSVADGTLDLDFITEQDNAKVSAIRIDSASGGNAPPNANDDSATTAASAASAAVAIDVLANDNDLDGDALAIQSVTDPASGSVAVNDKGTADPFDDVLVYTPDIGFTGDDAFTYTVSDGKGEVDSAAVSVTVTGAGEIAFDRFALTGVPDRSYTSLQFGPDGRLYASERFGEIYAFDIEEQVDPGGRIAGFSATQVETIELIRSIPNHNDDGVLNTAITRRQVTGVAVAGDAANPVIYVGSSDPREGGGSGGGKGDTGLDTNSGVISRLTWNGASWEKLDLVRGLPRSEENHSTNGLALDVDPETGHRILLVAQGGHTNAGAPSANFAFGSEYALSAAILKLDLTTLESGAGDFAVKSDGASEYVYDLPTVLGPVFGGRDGLNQARLVEGGPVSVYSSGWRNAYDLTITESGELYTIDNGANEGWGGLPDGEGSPQPTNKLPVDDPNGFQSVNNLDHLERVAGPGYYGGHPNPIRANPDGAGQLFTGTGGEEIWSQTPNGLWPPVDPAFAFPQDGDFLLPGVEDGALATWTVSTNGLDEYTASNFEGGMKGDLVAAAFNSSIYRVALDPAGGPATKEAIASGLSGTPLDVTTQGDFDAFPGTIWIAYVAGAADIEVLAPTLVSGTADDLDGDGYGNEDEIANGANPNNPSSTPPDKDGDLVSDLNDDDDDDDALPDPVDNFSLDALNGTGLTITDDQGFFNPLRNDDPGFGFNGLGFTGWMTDGETDYLALYDDDNLIAGGTSGILSIIETGPGDARGALNTQENAFQFGVGSDLSGSVQDSFLFTARMLNVFSPLAADELATGQSAGIQIGTGDQDNYVKLAVAADGSDLDMLLLHEEEGVVLSESFLPTAVDIGAQVDLFLEIDPAAGTVAPGWQVDGGALETGATIALGSGSPILAAIQGMYLNQGRSSAMAAGVIATHGATGAPFSAQYDHLNVYAGSLLEQATTSVVLASSALETQTYDTRDTFIYSYDLDHDTVSRLEWSGRLPPGRVSREALPPGFERNDHVPREINDDGSPERGRASESREDDGQRPSGPLRLDASGAEDDGDLAAFLNSPSAMDFS